MRYLYSWLFYLILPPIYLRLWWKGRKNPGYRQDWQQRLGYVNPDLNIKHCIWVHAVSVGEMIAAKPIILALQQRYPNYPIVTTHMTPTGLALARQMQGEYLHALYLPYDVPAAVQRFLNSIQPRIAIIIETELWPNLIYYTAQRHVPIVLANARLSEKSARGYQKISSITGEMLQNFSWILVQTQDEAARYTALGANPNSLLVTGSIKFDIPAPEQLVAQGRALRAGWEGSRPVIIAASTHAGEEEQVLSAFSQIKKVLPNALLILVPRHQERFEAVAALCQKQGFSVLRRSQNLPCSLQTEIFLGDSLGELFLYYAAADVAFVGGSLVPTGGHNLLEPAAIGLASITGPNIFNFKEIFHLLESAEAVVPVSNETELAEAAITLLQDPQRRQIMGANALAVVDKNRGALKKHIDHIVAIIERRDNGKTGE